MTEIRQTTPPNRTAPRHVLNRSLNQIRPVKNAGHRADRAYMALTLATSHQLPM